MNSTIQAQDSFLARLARQAVQLSEASEGEIAILQGDLVCAVATDDAGFHQVPWRGTALESILDKTGFVSLRSNGSPLPPRLVQSGSGLQPAACTGINLNDKHGNPLGALIVYFARGIEPAVAHRAALSGLAGLIETWIRELVVPASELPSWVNSPDGGLPSFRCTLSLDGRILEAGPGWQSVTGLSPEQSRGARLSDLLARCCRQALDRLIEQAAGGGAAWAPALELAGRNSFMVGPVSAVMLFRAGVPDRIFVSGWSAGQTLRPEIQFSPREILEDCIRAHFVTPPPERPLLPVAVVDLDGFSRVNELFGYSVGDQVLASLVHRIRQHVGASSCVSRIGGDTFALALPACADPTEALQAGQGILDLIDRPVAAGPRPVSVSASMGIALAPLHGADPDLILRHAEAALRQVKRRGKSHVSLFDLAWMVSQLERRRLEADFSRALLEREFRLLYQPQVTLTGKLAGLEALLEWQHPELGRLRPARFIAIAEESGYIGRIGAWVLREAVERAEGWHRRGLLPQRIAVNVSPLQFSRPDFVSLVQSVLGESGLPACCLELELTESALLDEPWEVGRSLEALRALGVSLCLDDFGVGYSSLHNLKALPLDAIKIDRSFVESLGDPSDALALIHTVTILARNRGLRVIAEGVETEEQARQLVLARCDLAQGYLFGMPLPWEQTEELLSGRPAWGDLSQPEYR